MKGRPIPWSPAELAWIEARATEPRRAAHARFVATFDRPDVSLAAFAALCKRRGWMTGRTGRFAPGQAPVYTHPKGWCPPGCEKGHFRKGNLPHNTRHAGHERINREGYVEISVEETNPHTGFERRYVQKHRWLWEKAHGPVPEGQVLKCLDGDRTNCDPANWIAIPRALLPRLNGRFGRNYDTAPPELKPLILKIAELEHAAREKRRARTAQS